MNASVPAIINNNPPSLLIWDIPVPVIAIIVVFLCYSLSWVMRRAGRATLLLALIDSWVVTDQIIYSVTYFAFIPISRHPFKAIILWRGFQRVRCDLLSTTCGWKEVVKYETMKINRSMYACTSGRDICQRGLQSQLNSCRIYNSKEITILLGPSFNGEVISIASSSELLQKLSLLTTLFFTKLHSFVTHRIWGLLNCD